MTENTNNYMEESLWEVENFLIHENIDKDLFNDAIVFDKLIPPKTALLACL